MFIEIAFLTRRLTINIFLFLNPIGRKTPVIKKVCHMKKEAQLYNTYDEAYMKVLCRSDSERRSFNRQETPRCDSLSLLFK